MRKIKLFTLLFILSTFVVSLFAQGQLISFTTKKVKGDAVVISILGEGKSYIEWENGIKEPFSMNGAQNILLKSSSFKIGSENGKFEWLYCKDNELTKLDLTNAKDLTYISCMNNQLKELNTSKNLNLKHLYCSKNNLTNLDLSGNFSLKNLDCSENKLTELNISNNKKLVKLFCNTNFLTSLSLEGKENLTVLYCFENNINQVNMEVIIEALNTTSDDKIFSPVQPESKLEHNVCTSDQVKKAKNKQWLVGYYNESGEWEDFEGNKSTTNPNEKYEVSIIPAENGKVTINEKVDLKAVAEGTILHVSAIPNIGYKLSALTANEKDIMQTKSFIVEGNTTIKAVFEKTKTYIIKLLSNEKGSISIKDYTNEMLNNVAEGSQLTILDNPKAGCRLSSLTANNEDILSTKSFTVTTNTEVKATFETITYPVIVKQPTHGKIIIANYTEEQLKNVPIGTTLKVSVTPDKGYKLSSIRANNEDITKTMSLVVTGETTVEATLEVITHQVSITINGNGTVYIVGMSGADLNKVPEGKTLKVKAEGKNDKCILTKLTANDLNIIDKRTFVVDTDIIVYAEFVDHTSTNTIAKEETQFTINKNTAIVKSRPGEIVKLFDMNGCLIQNTIISRNTEAILDLSSLSGGLYIIKVGKQQIKFKK